ncbi:MAG: ATP-binding protein [Actinobacteria bacterium]|nr:ATP-binding protein [Actinomycetota bacterium]
MATSEMIEELIRAHVSGDGDRFRRIALQVAARESRSGHRLVAGRIRDLIDEAAGEVVEPEPGPTPIVRPSESLQGILAVRYPHETLRDIVLEGEAERAIDRLLEESRSERQLKEWGLAPRRRLLFHGPPGCGKTLAATVVAGELGLPLFRVRVETLFSRFMGKTASLLAEIFEQAQRKRGVYLFDEFDAIGKHRGDENDVGEARRIVSTFLQLLDGDEGPSLVIAATNERGALDRALFRRFDDVVLFDLPSDDGLRRLLELRTSSHSLSETAIEELTQKARGLSYADVTTAVTNAVKSMVLGGRDELREGDLVEALEEIAGQRDTTG